MWKMMLSVVAALLLFGSVSTNADAQLFGRRYWGYYDYPTYEYYYPYNSYYYTPGYYGGYYSYYTPEYSYYYTPTWWWY